MIARIATGSSCADSAVPSAIAVAPLLDQQRVASAGLLDLLGGGLGLGNVAEQSKSQLATRFRRQRLERDTCIVRNPAAPAGAGVEQLASRKREEHRRDPPDVGGQPLDQVEERRSAQWTSSGATSGQRSRFCFDDFTTYRMCDLPLIVAAVAAPPYRRLRQQVSVSTTAINASSGLHFSHGRLEYPSRGSRQGLRFFWRTRLAGVLSVWQRHPSNHLPSLRKLRGGAMIAGEPLLPHPVDSAG